MTLHSMTNEEVVALLQYANQHGRTWKARLLNDWQWGAAQGPLQQIRNSYGPTWLSRVTYGALESEYNSRLPNILGEFIEQTKIT